MVRVGRSSGRRELCTLSSAQALVLTSFSYCNWMSFLQRMCYVMLCSVVVPARGKSLSSRFIEDQLGSPCPCPRITSPCPCPRALGLSPCPCHRTLGLRPKSLSLSSNLKSLILLLCYEQNKSNELTTELIDTFVSWIIRWTERLHVASRTRFTWCKWSLTVVVASVTIVTITSVIIIIVIIGGSGGGSRQWWALTTSKVV